MMEGKDIFATVGMLVVMVLVFVGAYYASRMLAQHYQSGGGRSGNVKILERTAIGQNTWLVLVQVRGQVHLLGVTQKQITCLSTFPEDKIESLPQQDLPTVNFKEILRKFREKEGDTHATDKTQK